MEREGLRSIKRREKTKFRQKLSKMEYLRVIKNFINETRIRRKRIYEDLKLGLTFEYALIINPINTQTKIFNSCFPNLSHYPNEHKKHKQHNVRDFIENNSIFYGDGCEKAKTRSENFIKAYPIPEEDNSLLVFQDINLTAMTAMYIKKKNDLKHGSDFSSEIFYLSL